jgi:hypothetical protein
MFVVFGYGTYLVSPFCRLGFRRGFYRFGISLCLVWKFCAFYRLCSCAPIFMTRGLGTSHELSVKIIQHYTLIVVSSACVRHLVMHNTGDELTDFVIQSVPRIKVTTSGECSLC